jgi:hypothetical protein
MRLSLLVTTMLALAYFGAVPRALAEPLVAISCDKPKGFVIEYAPPYEGRIEAIEKKLPMPPPVLTGPTESDFYPGKVRFVIDSDKRKMTVIWDNEEFRKKANMPQLAPPPATNATVVHFRPWQIFAIELEENQIWSYSFFPKLGIVFISQQAGLVVDARDISTFAHCQFSWTNPNDEPDKWLH